MNPPNESQLNPFPGLRPFQLEEDYLFFGRDEQTAELLGRLRKGRLLAVVGTSGSGKSSLVRAGMLPALLRGKMSKAGSDWEVAVMRPGGKPVWHLAHALVEGGLYETESEDDLFEIEATLTRNRNGLVEAVRQSGMPTDTNFLLVIDQFEELFRFNQGDSRARNEASDFVDLLLAACRQDEQKIYVVITMRSDFLGDCSQFSGLAEAVNDGEYLIPRLTRDQLQEAIEGPIKVGGAEIAPRLLQRLLNDVGENPDQLPVLQHALMRTWSAAQADPSSEARRAKEDGVILIDLEHYENVGGMREALSRHADEAFAQLPDGRHREVAEKVFKALTEWGTDNRGIRRPTRLALLSDITGASEDEVRGVVDEYRQKGRTFLMPPEGLDLMPETVVDISHESLMRVWVRLKQWVQEEVQSARIYQRLAETAALHREGKAGLYHDPDLQIALSWKAENQPTAAWARRYHTGFELALGFLETSREAAEKEARDKEEARQRELKQAQDLAQAEHLRAQEQLASTRRMKWMMSGMTVVAVIAVFFLVFALQESKRANEQKALAQETATRQILQRSTERLAAGDTATALSSLAKLLREQPDNRVVSDRLFVELGSRNFSIPIAQLKHESATDYYTGVVPNSWPHGAHFSPDGRWVVTAARGSSARIWDAHTGQQAGKPLQHQDWVQSAEFSPDSQRVVTASSDGTARVWDVQTGREVLPPLDHGETQVHHASFSFDGKWVATAARNRSIGLWDAQSGQAVWVAETNLYSPQALQFSRDGKRLLISDNNNARLWDVDNRRELTRLRRESDVVAQLSPDGKHFCVVDDQTFEIILKSDGKESALHLQHDERIETVAFSPNSRWLATGVISKNTATVWDVNTGVALFEPLAHRDWVNHVCFSPDSRLLLTGSRDGTVRIWEARTGKPLSEALQHDRAINYAEFSPDGRGLLTRTGGSTFWLWDIRLAQPMTLSWPHPESVRRATFSPEGTRIVTAAHDGAARIWDVTTGAQLTGPLRTDQLPPTIRRYIAPPSSMFDAVFSPDGRLVATTRYASRDKSGLFDATTGKCLNNWSAPGVSANHINFSPDGTKLIDTTGGGCIIWNLQSEAPHVPQGILRHTNRVGNAVFSPDGQLVLTVGADKSARLWDAETAEPMVAPMRHRGAVQWGEFSPDGSRIATIATDGLARIWETRSGKLMDLPPMEHAGEIYLHFILRYSPDGTRLAIAAGNNAHIWDVKTGLPAVPPMTHEARVNSVRFSPDGTRLLTACNDGNARIWHTASGHLVQELTKHTERVTYAEFSPDGTKVVTASGDGTAKLWHLPVRPALSSSKGTKEVLSASDLADLAEAVAGRRIDENGVTQKVPATELIALSDRFSGSREEWPRWFFENSTTRRMSADEASLPMSAYVEHLIQAGTLNSLQQASWLAPSNALAKARLAVALLKEGLPSRNPGEGGIDANLVAEAEGLSRAALNLAPDQREILLARSEVLELAGHHSQALEIIDTLLSRQRDDPPTLAMKARLLEQLDRLPEALQFHTRTIELLEPLKMAEEIAPFYEARSRILTNLNRSAEAHLDSLRAIGISDRPEGVPPHLLDLSPYYNRRFAGYISEDTEAKALQGEYGVPFDARGMLHLGSTGVPLSAEGISVNQTCQGLHFLLRTSTGSRHSGAAPELFDGRPAGRIVVHYADGTQTNIHLTYAQDVCMIDDYRFLQGGLDTGIAKLQKWNNVTQRYFFINLTHLDWVNPFPERSIKTIDLHCDPTGPNLGLVALTTQADPLPTIVMQPQSLEVQQGDSAALEVKVDGTNDWHFQWQLNGQDIPHATNAILQIPNATPTHAGRYTAGIRSTMATTTYATLSRPARLRVRGDGLVYGGLQLEVYQDIEGLSISDLTNHAKFPDQPDAVDIISSCEIPYVRESIPGGKRVSGYVLPPRTGEYRFYVAVDDTFALFLSPNENPGEKRLIAASRELDTREVWWTYPRCWINNDKAENERTSNPVHLEAGRKYYFEALTKHDDVRPYFGVAWQLPGDPPPKNGDPPISGAYFAAPAPPKGQPLNQK